MVASLISRTLPNGMLQLLSPLNKISVFEKPEFLKLPALQAKNIECSTDTAERNRACIVTYSQTMRRILRNLLRAPSMKWKPIKPQTATETIVFVRSYNSKKHKTVPHFLVSRIAETSRTSKKQNTTRKAAPNFLKLMCETYSHAILVSSSSCKRWVLPRTSLWHWIEFDYSQANLHSIEADKFNLGNELSLFPLLVTKEPVSLYKTNLFLLSHRVLSRASAARGGGKPCRQPSSWNIVNWSNSTEQNPVGIKITFFRTCP